MTHERVYLAGRMALGDRAPAQAEDIGLIAIVLFLVLALSLGQQARQARPSARTRSSPLDLTPMKEHPMTLHQIAHHELTGGLRLEVYRAPSGETTATLHSPTCTIEAHHTMTGDATIANALMMSWAANTLVFAASAGNAQELLLASRSLALQAQQLRRHASIQPNTPRA